MDAPLSGQRSGQRESQRNLEERKAVKKKKGNLITYEDFYEEDPGAGGLSSAMGLETEQENMESDEFGFGYSSSA